MGPALCQLLGDPTDQHVQPVSNLGKRIVDREVVVPRPRDWAEHLQDGRPSAWEWAAVAGGTAAQHGHEMSRVTEQPSAPNADAIVSRRRDVAALGHLDEQTREVGAGIDRERERVPEPVSY